MKSKATVEAVYDTLVPSAEPTSFQLSVGVTSRPYHFEIEGLFTQGSRPSLAVGESVGGILKMDNSDWLNGTRYHVFDTRPNTEFTYRVRVAAPHHEHQGGDGRGLHQRAAGERPEPRHRTLVKQLLHQVTRAR